VIPTSATIAESVIQVLELTLGFSATAVEDACDLERVASLVAYVGISGPWQGALTLEVPVSLARSAAAAMFLVEEDHAGRDEMSDALGELANQLAGSLKGCIASGSQLSLPTVTEGGDYRVTVVGSSPVAEARLESRGSRMRVVLHQRRAA